MVRAVIGHETHVAAFVDNLIESGTILQIGLVVGRFGTGSSRDVVLALIPTPQNDGIDVAFVEGDGGIARETDKRKGAKAKVSSQHLRIDIDWIGEHARQVSKMLVGGISVMGIYILTNDNAFKNSLPILWQTSKVVATLACSKEHRDSLLLHFAYSPTRVSCKSCSFESSFGSTSLHPCEWKSGKLPSFHNFGCLYNFDLRVPVLANKLPKKRLLDVLFSAMSMESSRLGSALAAVDGILVTQDCQDKVLTGDTNHEVELFLPLGCGEDGSSGEVMGLAIMTGSVRALANCFSHDPLQRIITELKEDIVKSLKSRLEILYDDVDLPAQDVGSNGEKLQDSNNIKLLHPLQQINGAVRFQSKLPNRIFAPWKGGVFVCDYMQEGESLQDVSSRCMELLGMDKPLVQSEVLELEALSPGMTDRSFWEAIRNNSDAQISSFQGSDDGQANKNSRVKAVWSTTALASLLVLLLACLVGYFVSKNALK